mgnify:CR=1 FL=1
MIVAAFGVTSSLIIFVTHKTREIGLLKALGADYKHELIGDIRGRGLAIGVEIVKDKFSKKEEAKNETAKIVYRAYQLGLIIFYVGMKSNVLELTPPLILNEKQAKEGLEILDQAISDVTNGIISDSILDEFKGW